VRPLPRACRERADSHRVASLLQRTVEGDSLIARSQSRSCTVLCSGHTGGDCTAIRVWCSPVGWHRHTAMTSGHVTAGGRRRDHQGGNKRKNPRSGGVWRLTTGDLIRVRTQRFLSFVAFNPLVRFAMVTEAVAMLFHGYSIIVSIHDRYCTVIRNNDFGSSIRFPKRPEYV
jgi:hypothetical protein